MFDPTETSSASASDGNEFYDDNIYGEPDDDNSDDEFDNDDNNDDARSNASYGENLRVRNLFSLEPLAFNHD